MTVAEDNHLLDQPCILPEQVSSFFSLLRDNGLVIGPGELEYAMRGLQKGMLNDRQHCKFCLKSICCGSREDTEIFDALFEKFWVHEDLTSRNTLVRKRPVQVHKNEKNSLIYTGGTSNKEDEKTVEGKETSGANRAERLRKTDFSKLTEMESQELDELARQLWKQMSYRMKRRMRMSRQKGKLDFGKTIRRSMARGGWPNELVLKNRKPSKRQLVLLLDVSGSMDKYSFFLLKFMYVLRQYFVHIEAFVFSTELVRVTKFLDQANLMQNLKTVSERTNCWSGGTRIGECFDQFINGEGKYILSRSSIVVILSDGLDTGSETILANAIHKIKMKASQVVWLNPLMGMEGYEPIQKGMKSALPYIDEFRASHNLDSLLQLEKFLAYV